MVMRSGLDNMPKDVTMEMNSSNIWRKLGIALVYEFQSTANHKWDKREEVERPPRLDVAQVIYSFVGVACFCLLLYPSDFSTHGLVARDAAACAVRHEPSLPYRSIADIRRLEVGQIKRTAISFVKTISRLLLETPQSSNFSYLERRTLDPSLDLLLKA